MPKLGTRDELIRCGVLIAEYGIERLTLNAVADRMGLTRQAVCYHFKTDDGIRAAVCEHAARLRNPYITGQMRARRRAPGA